MWPDSGGEFYIISEWKNVVMELFQSIEYLNRLLHKKEVERGELEHKQLDWTPSSV